MKKKKIYFLGGRMDNKYFKDGLIAFLSFIINDIIWKSLSLEYKWYLNLISFILIYILVYLIINKIYKHK